MAIHLGDLQLDEAHTAIKEKLEEIGGRFERRVTLAGVIAGKSSAAHIEAALDALLDAVSPDTFTATLSLRPGRRLLVRRESFKRELNAEHLTGAFELGLLAEQPFEEAINETSVIWNIAASGSDLVIAAGGNAPADAHFVLTADGDLVNPALSSGGRSIVYEGIVPDGETLVFDGVNRVVTLMDEDVTPYTIGVFPLLLPNGGTLVYTDDASSSHAAQAVITYRERWW